VLVDIAIANALALLWLCACLRLPKIERRARLVRPFARPVTGWGLTYVTSLFALIAWSWWLGLSAWLRLNN